MTGYEKRDLRPSSVALSIAAFLGLAVVAAIVAIPVLHAFTSGRARTGTAGVALPREGGEEWVPDVMREREELHAEEERNLGSYGWISREGRVVRIPIERAIELLAQRGLPARETGR
jgi:hypothetical protein